jgi:SAM-dependent methyltransferase
MTDSLTNPSVSLVSADTPSAPPEAPAFWEHFYQSNELPWDLGEPAPPFVDFLAATTPETLPRGRMVVLGAGAGHDAALFAQAGFEVVGLDYATGAVERATARYGQWAHFELADIFELPADWNQTADYVLEHTCFCAIPPSRRTEYVQTAHRLLKPNGILIGLFWAHSNEGGPPYKTDEAELRQLFEPFFTFETMIIPPRSVERRQGEERLAVLRRKA